MVSLKLTTSFEVTIPKFIFMDHLLNIQFNWGNFLLAAVCLLALFMVLQFIYGVIHNIKLPKNTLHFSEGILSKILLIYEPVSILILTGIFILINPSFHGLLILLFVMFSFGHLKNYISGFLLRFDANLVSGNQIAVKDAKGTISEVCRRHLKLKSDDGVHILPYNKLLTEGYTLASSKQMGGFHQLVVRKTEGENSIIHEQKNLMDLLVMTPYVDWNYKTEITPLKNTENNTFKINVHVKSKSHLYDLIILINESGYTCEHAN